MSTRVLIHAVARATSPTGVCRHAANIAKAVALYDPAMRPTLLVGAWQADYYQRLLLDGSEGIDVRPVQIANTSLSRNWFATWGLAAWMRTHQHDVLHLAYPHPVLPRLDNVPLVTSLHDLFPWDTPESFARKFACANAFCTRWGLEAADAIAVVSRTTLASLQRRFPALARRTVLIPNASALPTATQTANTDGPPYLLAVAQHRAHKRLDVLLQTFAELRDRGDVHSEMSLVFVGESGPETARLHAMVQRLELGAHVRWMRQLSDQKLLELYRSAEALLAPARLEGYGLPVAEALAVGCRVVCSRIPAHVEVASDCAEYFSTDAGAPEIADAVLRALRNPPRTARGQSSLLEVGEAYVDLYRRLRRPRLVARERSRAQEENARG